MQFHTLWKILSQFVSESTLIWNDYHNCKDWMEKVLLFEIYEYICAYMCVCVCMYVCVYIYTHTHTYIHRHIYTTDTQLTLLIICTIGLGKVYVNGNFLNHSFTRWYTYQTMCSLFSWSSSLWFHKHLTSWHISQWEIILTSLLCCSHQKSFTYIKFIKNMYTI